MTTHQQELQQKYFKFMSQLGRDFDVPLPTPKDTPRRSRKDPSRRSKSQAQPQSQAPTSISRTLQPFRTTHVVLDSSHRDIFTYPTIAQFSLSLAEPLTDVVAIRLLRSEFYPESNRTTAAYLYVNGYVHTLLANDTTPPIYTRIPAGFDTLPGMTSHILEDPYTFHLQPREPRLRRFDIQLFEEAGLVTNLGAHASLVLSFAIYHLPRGESAFG